MKEIFNYKDITRLYRMHKVYSWKNRAEHLMFLIKYYIVILSSLVPSSTSKTFLMCREILILLVQKFLELSSLIKHTPYFTIIC